MGDEPARWWNAPVFMALLKNALLGLGFLALLLFVVRPLLKTLKAESPPGFEPLESPEEQVKKIVAAQRAQIASQSMNQLELVEKIKQEPYQTSQVLKNWIESKGKAAS